MLNPLRQGLRKTMSPTSLAKWGEKILLTEDPLEKVQLTLDAGAWWRSASDLPIGEGTPLDIPPRPSSFNIVSVFKAPRCGKAGSLSSRITILHALANVEQWAIDTAWDNIVRFGSQPVGAAASPLPRPFYDDFVKMALDEAKHFNWLTKRLADLNSKFGDLPIHAGIWDSASGTKHSLPARMAIVHMVHEARGLDVNPATIANFRKNKDEASAQMLETIYTDEITHVAIGTRWFKYYCAEHPEVIEAALKEAAHELKPVTENGKVEIEDGATLGLQNYPAAAQYFHLTVHRHFFGKLKPPFNYSARDEAELPRDFYEPIAQYPPSPFTP
ncbi:hypothetical protein DSO57_1029435 [Entomophthora muscae]|uniref:Uncharacterized protein n=1 Tax=Entomophthora muscae TaxID=34485 RepID=A0ACC2RFW4_9FUNG|nr:hypothetical protein DSO57_1029435 [Entomophthora muscae]